MGFHLSAPARLLRELSALGIEVRAAPPDLLVRGRVDERLWLRLRAEKAALLRHLERTPTFSCRACKRFAFPESRSCYWCEKATQMRVEA